MGKAKLNIPMCAALVLLLLTMISVHMTSGLYARYTSTVTVSDSARVAKFDVTTVVTPVAGENGKYNLNVTANSEVAVTYHMDLVFTESLGDALSGNKLAITVDGDSGDWNEATKTLSFSNIDTLNPGPANKNHTLLFDILDWTFVTAGESGDEITKVLSFTANVTAEQVD